MEANQLATKGDLEQLFSRMQALLQQQPAPAAQEEYLTLDEVATAARVSTKTVKKWVQEGKYDLKGRKIQLFALEFSPGYLRIPRSALVAYGSGVGFSIENLKNIPAMRVA